MDKKRKASQLPPHPETVAKLAQDGETFTQKLERAPAKETMNKPQAIPNDELPRVARLVLDGETFAQIVAILGQDVAEVIQLAHGNEVGLVAPWKSVL